MANTAHVSQKKLDEVVEMVELLNQYSIIGLVNLEKVPAKALHNLRDTLRGDVVIRMTKKKLLLKAFEQSDKKNLLELLTNFRGISALLLTDMNPLKLAQYLESKAVKGAAKPGDIAPIEILVKAGDTKIAPGPIISELNQNLRVQTMIKNGTIHIRNDKVTHKVGDLIDAKQSQLLARLGVEPMTIKLDFYSAWENGDIIPESVLHLDLNSLLEDVKLAASQALNLALGLGMVTSETIPPLMAKAAREAIALGMEVPIFIPDLLEQYVSKAFRTAKAVEAAAFGTVEDAAPAEEEEKKKEEVKSDDEELGAGLGSLFG